MEFVQCAGCLFRLSMEVIVIHDTYDSNLPGDVILKPQKLQSLPEALCTLVPAFLGSLEVVMIDIADDGSR